MKIEKGKQNKVDLPIEIKDLGERSVQFTISKEVTDRDGDILRAGGVDFSNYMKNAVFLSFHNTREFPLGKVTKFWVEGNSVKAIVYFPTLEELSSDPAQASEKAKLVDFTYHCYKTGMLNAVSVGFIPLEWTETKDGYDITKWELLEFSAVAVPANQDAIAEAVKSFGDDFAKDFVSPGVMEKSGKKISAETRAVLDKIKGCGDEIEKCYKELKRCGGELKKLLAELDDIPEPEGDSDGDNPDDTDDGEIELPDTDDGEDKTVEF
jgi:hypothetical protein